MIFKEGNFQPYFKGFNNSIKQKESKQLTFPNAKNIKEPK